MSFHEILFPTGISLGARGGPERLTEVVLTGSGREERNQRWRRSRRKWNAGYGVRRLSDIDQVVAFFEERRGRLFGFRWRDPLDHRSCAPGVAPGPRDQVLGIGNGSRTQFQLVKTYGQAFDPYARDISKPVAGSVRIAVAGVERHGRLFSAFLMARLMATVFPRGHGKPTGQRHEFSRWTT